MKNKYIRAIFYPSTALCAVLTLISAVFLIYAMRSLPENAPLRIGSYLLAFYSLCVVCLKIPHTVRAIRRFREENPHMRRWFSDRRLRMKTSLTANFCWNGAYALFQLALGIYHHALWYYALAAYYFSLALMRALLMRHTLRYQPHEQMRAQLRRCRNCGYILLLTNTALSVMIFFMVFDTRPVRHNEITAIAMAAYTFTSLGTAICNAIAHRGFEIPVFSAAKAVSLVTASVSMLTLENTMLAVFRTDTMTEQTVRLFMLLGGSAVSLLIITTAIRLISSAQQKINTLENEHGQ